MLQTQDKIITNDAEFHLLIYMVIVLIVISLLIILFFFVFQKRKNKLILDKINQQKAFDEELVKTQQEIQEETLKYVGRELHDNIGQLLAIATMQLKAADKVADDTIKPKLTNASEAVKTTLTEVRALSKSLNNDVIFNLGFDAIVKNEVNRLNKSGLIDAKLDIIGNRIELENKKDKLFLFRILQEFISNSLKYASAELLHINLNYQKEFMTISANDNGEGFDSDDVEKGSGFINMEKRAELIEADFDLTSQVGNGTRLVIKYPYRSVN
ncbi:sensor histidine kinase [Winogradskyella sp. A2]|uniref:sensor histidine kinase n=1 Tax=Winogradskyella sp. A2 TaxID=3366944 RepID=UPI00398C599E